MITAEGIPASMQWSLSTRDQINWIQEQDWDRAPAVRRQEVQKHNNDGGPTIRCAELWIKSARREWINTGSIPDFADNDAKAHAEARNRTQPLMSRKAKVGVLLEA